jgi:hypothetical protein
MLRQQRLMQSLIRVAAKLMTFGFEELEKRIEVLEESRRMKSDG